MTKITLIPLFIVGLLGLGIWGGYEFFNGPLWDSFLHDTKGTTKAGIIGTILAGISGFFLMIKWMNDDL